MPPADGAAPEAGTPEPRAPRLAAAPSGQRVVFLLEAAHVVLAPLLGRGWSCERRVVTAPSGRQRLKGRAAGHATTRALFSVTHRTSSTSETVGT